MPAMDPLHAAIYACLGAAGLCWLLGALTREYSWVDRLWSILPPAYVVWFASQSPEDPRLKVMVILAVLWGARLTYNFARKGGYAPGGEDYRWIELRRRLPPKLFAAFHLGFIALFQNALLLLLALPAHAAAGASAPWGPLDSLATIAFLVLLLGETIADQQQWRFQCAKKARGAAYGPKFLTQGLFRYSRHPNFFCEISLWWAFYLFSVAAGAGWLNATIAGPIALTLLFQGSTAFTESLSRAKYPSYADYQRRTSRLVPWFPRG
jgi:steroid 5-alpha reductase family enzyme